MFSFLCLLAMIGAGFGFDAWQSGARGRGRTRRRVASGRPVPDHAPHPPLATGADAGAFRPDMPPEPDVIVGEYTLAAALLAGEWDVDRIPARDARSGRPAAPTAFDPTREVQVFGKPAIRLTGGAGAVGIGTDDVVQVATS